MSEYVCVWYIWISRRCHKLYIFSKICRNLKAKTKEVRAWNTDKNERPQQHISSTLYRNSRYAPFHCFWFVCFIYVPCLRVDGLHSVTLRGCNFLCTYVNVYLFRCTIVNQRMQIDTFNMMETNGICESFVQEHVGSITLSTFCENHFSQSLVHKCVFFFVFSCLS